MNPQRRSPIAFVGLTVLAMLAGTAFADEGLHVNPTHEECDIQFTPGLTQSAFSRFTREGGDIIIHKSAGADVLGAGRFELGLGYFQTPIEQYSDAWNDTFTHPDADHPLGDAIATPAVYGRVGLSRGMELGGYWTGNPKASYKFAGLGLKYDLPWQPAVVPGLAASLDWGILYGPDDTTVNALGMDLHAGRTWKAITAYASAGVAWAHAVERSPVVDLHTEDVFSPHGGIGVSPRVWGPLQIDLRARFAAVNTFEVRFGHIF